MQFREIFGFSLLASLAFLCFSGWCCSADFWIVSSTVCSSPSSAMAVDCALDDGQTREMMMHVNAGTRTCPARGVRRGLRYKLQWNDRATVALEGRFSLPAGEVLLDREAKGRRHRSISLFPCLLGQEEETWRWVRFGCGQCHRRGMHAAIACQPSTASPRQRL